MEFLEEFLIYTQKKGVKDVELFYQKVEKEHISICDGEIENFQLSKEGGLGIRVLRDCRQGFAYTNNLSNLDITLEKAIKASEQMSEDDNIMFSKGSKGIDIKKYKEDPPNYKKIEFLKEVEKKIYSKDKRIKRVKNVTWEKYKIRSFILNTLGTNLEYNYQYQYAYTEIGVSDGKDEKSSWDFKSGRVWDDIDFEDLVNKVTWKGTALLGAKSKKSQRAEIIIPPSQAKDILSVFASAFSSDNVQKGKSILKGLLGEKIAHDKLNIIEDPTSENAFIRREFDDEGVKTKKKYLIKNGYLEEYLYNLYTAKKENKESTGNGERINYRALPNVGFFNLFIEPGEKTEEEIIKTVKEGLYVFSLMGLHLIDPISGDFSIGADGLWIRNGELAEPVCEVTISGNLKDFLKSIVDVGNNITFDNTVVSPTLRVINIMIAGK